jgi:hypothetical protein
MYTDTVEELLGYPVHETTRICPSLRFAVYYFIDLIHQYNYVCIVYTV